MCAGEDFMENKTVQRKALTTLTMSMILFGTIGICRRAIALPSDVLAFGRGIMGSVFLLIVLKGSGRGIRFNGIRKRAAILLAVTGAMIGMNWILLFEAYNYTTVAVATLCYYMQPVIVTILSPFVLREKLTGKQIVCVSVSVLGMVLVSGAAGGGTPGNPKGIVLGLGAAMLYASVVLLNKRITDIPVFEKTIIQLFSAAIVMIPYMAVSGTLHTYDLPASGILLFLIVGIVHTGAAYAMYFGSIEHLPARTCALMSYIDPVTAVILSALFLREPMGAAGVTGTILIIGSALYGES